VSPLKSPIVQAAQATGGGGVLVFGIGAESSCRVGAALLIQHCFPPPQSVTPIQSWVDDGVSQE